MQEFLSGSIKSNLRLLHLEARVLLKEIPTTDTKFSISLFSFIYSI